MARRAIFSLKVPHSPFFEAEKYITGRKKYITGCKKYLTGRWIYLTAPFLKQGLAHIPGILIRNTPPVKAGGVFICSL